jgi:hypothetical protein
MATNDRPTGTSDEHYNVISVLYTPSKALKHAPPISRTPSERATRTSRNASVRCTAPTRSWPTGARRSCGNGSGSGVVRRTPRPDV